MAAAYNGPLSSSAPSARTAMDFLPHFRDLPQLHVGTAPTRSSSFTNLRDAEHARTSLLPHTPQLDHDSLHRTSAGSGSSTATRAGFFGLGRPTLPDVVQAGDPVLHEPAREVAPEDIGTPEVEKTINDMVAVMRAAPGVGLAANQIGVPLQIIVLEDTEELMRYSEKSEVVAQERKPFPLLVIINPKLKHVGSSKARFFEGCLSVTGFRGMVERHLEVEVSGLGRDGKPITVRASGWQARILQHECDHLAGLLYVDKIIPRTFRTAQNLRMPLPACCPRPGPCCEDSSS